MNQLRWPIAGNVGSQLRQPQPRIILGVADAKYIDIGFIDQAGVVFGITESQSVNLGFIDQTGVVFGITVTVAAVVDLSLPIKARAVVNTLPHFALPRVQGYVPPQTASLGFIDQTGVIFGITENQSVNLGFIDQTGTVFGITTSGGTVLTIDRLTPLKAPIPTVDKLKPARARVIAPVVALAATVDIPFIDQTYTIYDISFVVPAFFTAYTPDQTYVVEPKQPKPRLFLQLLGNNQSPTIGFIDQSGTVFALSVSQSAAVGFVDQTYQIYSVSTTHNTNIAIPFIDAQANIYGITIVTGVTAEVRFQPDVIPAVIERPNPNGPASLPLPRDIRA